MKKSTLLKLGGATMGVAIGATTLLSVTQPLAVGATTWGADAALADTDLTIEDMITYSLQDEYLALATYEAVVDAYGEVHPFTRLIVAETMHADALVTLASTYGIAPVEDTADTLVVLPESLDLAYETLLAAEADNIAMYEAFLAVDDLPDDVELVFTRLRDASLRHQAAGERIIAAIADGTYTGEFGSQNAQARKGFGYRIQERINALKQHATVTGQSIGDVVRNMFRNGGNGGRGARS